MVKRPFNDWGGDSLNKAGRLIAEFEGFSSTVYRCQAGVPTIGFGHTRGVVDGQTITKEDALRLLMSELSTLQKALASVIHVDVTEGQFVARIEQGKFRQRGQRVCSVDRYEKTAERGVDATTRERARSV